MYKKGHYIRLDVTLPLLLQGAVVHGSQGAAAGHQDVRPGQSAEATRCLRQVGVRPAECDGEGGQGGSPLGTNVRHHRRGYMAGVCYHNGPVYVCFMIRRA